MTTTRTDASAGRSTGSPDPPPPSAVTPTAAAVDAVAVRRSWPTSS